MTVEDDYEYTVLSKKELDSLEIHLCNTIDRSIIFEKITKNAQRLPCNIPCDVKLPPSSIFRKGVSMEVFLNGLIKRSKYPSGSKFAATIDQDDLIVEEYNAKLAEGIVKKLW